MLSSASGERLNSSPELPPDSGEVRSQLEKILATGLFQNSRRYPSLLRHVVESAIAGNIADLKERTIGVSVFGRDPAYDTSADPIVRTTASEVRKRLDEYYSQPARASELRISIPAGTYVPVFTTPPPPAPIAELGTAPAPRKLRRVFILAAAVLMLATVCLALVMRMESGGNPLHRFWTPALDHTPILVVVETLMGVTKPVSGSAAPAVTEIVDPRLYLIMNDSNSRLASYFSANGTPLQYELARNTTLARLRAHPFILRGAFNNPLTRQAVSSFRYALYLDRSTLVRQIVDRRDSSRHWDSPMTGTLSKDYALIARAPEPRTGQTMFVIAGLGERGSAAATEFLTNPRYMESFVATAPDGWEHRNLEIIIETDLAGGDWGEPRVVASEVW